MGVLAIAKIAISGGRSSNTTSAWGGEVKGALMSNDGVNMPKFIRFMG